MFGFSFFVVSCGGAGLFGVGFSEPGFGGKPLVFGGCVLSVMPGPELAQELIEVAITTASMLVRILERFIYIAFLYTQQYNCHKISLQPFFLFKIDKGDYRRKNHERNCQQITVFPA